MDSFFRTRRTLLQIGMFAPLFGCASFGGDKLGFQAVPVATEDKVAVPPGYRADVLYAWGDATGIAAVEFRWDGSSSAADQALQAGMHHDGIEFFPLEGNRALLAMNHEYTDDGLLHADGMKTWTADKVRKSQAAHGVSVIEIEQIGGGWRVVRPSKYARRVTAETQMAISGPAADSPLIGARQALGTINNCAAGRTPWGTYLTCEENFNGYFAHGGAIPPEMRRYGISARGAGYRWHEFDPRFDAQASPEEPNRFGWVVEIDPYDPQSQPVKRTALGRFKHEGAMVTLAKDRRVVVYMGDDERFEYIYKFVSSRPFDGKARDLLDSGTLYVARFNGDGSGSWLPLGNDERSLVYTRLAADAAGATRMDRPEWIAVHPQTGDVYVSLTNNDRRGADGQPGIDGPNPRANNVFGHIVRWSESGGDAAAASFRWSVFALAGEEKGFGSPDGLWFDPGGTLWIQTDISTSTLNRGPYAKLGNNQMLAADVASGEIRRFLTGPNGCEITGVTMAPDRRSLFINIQHPGEPASERSDPGAPRAVSNWPDFRADGRPRSATIVIRREDGGLVGS